MEWKLGLISWKDPASLPLQNATDFIPFVRVLMAIEIDDGHQRVVPGTYWHTSGEWTAVPVHIVDFKLIAWAALPLFPTVMPACWGTGDEIDEP